MSESLPDNLTFEQALAELENVVRELEDGQIDLEASLARYESGIALLKRCYQQLCEAEQRIVQLTGTEEEGKPILRPFEHTASADTESAEPRRRRKKMEEPEKEKLF